MIGEHNYPNRWLMMFVVVFGEKVFQSIIPRNVRLSEAPSFGLTILEYDRKSKGAGCVPESGAGSNKKGREGKGIWAEMGENREKGPLGKGLEED